MLPHTLILKHVVVPCASHAHEDIQFYALVKSHAKNFMHMEIQNLAKGKVI